MVIQIVGKALQVIIALKLSQKEINQLIEKLKQREFNQCHFSQLLLVDTSTQSVPPDIGGVDIFNQEGMSGKFKIELDNEIFRLVRTGLTRKQAIDVIIRKLQVKSNLSSNFSQSNLNVSEVAKFSRQMIKDSKKCVAKFPSLRTDKNACEVGLIPSRNQNFTLHTHTITEQEGGLEPSEKDKETTKKWKKDFLCIANSAEDRLVCSNKSDNFNKVVVSRRL